MSSTITALTSGGGLAMAGDTSGQLELKTNNGTTAVTISTAQKVGIGVTSPTYLLEVNGNPNFNSVGGVYLTCGTYDAIKNPSGNILAFGGVTASQWDTTALYTGGTERMRIDSSGNVLVGTTNATGDGGGVEVQPNYQNGGFLGLKKTSSSASGDRFQYFTRNGSVIGSITQNGTTAVAYNTSSDYRLKEDIAPMTDALATVSALKPVTYKWKSDNSDGQGFIAHELAEIVPDCVTGAKDAIETYKDEDGNEQTRPVYQGIDTSFLVATLTAAIQELNAKVDAQALEIQALKGVA